MLQIGDKSHQTTKHHCADRRIPYRSVDFLEPGLQSDVDRYVLAILLHFEGVVCAHVVQVLVSFVNPHSRQRTARSIACSRLVYCFGRSISTERQTREACANASVEDPKDFSKTSARHPCKNSGSSAITRDLETSSSNDTRKKARSVEGILASLEGERASVANLKGWAVASDFVVCAEKATFRSRRSLWGSAAFNQAALWAVGTDRTRPTLTRFWQRALVCVLLATRELISEGWH